MARPRTTPRKVTLGTAEPAFGLPIISRCPDSVAVGEHDEVRQPLVDTNGRGGIDRREWGVRKVHLDSKTNIPAAQHVPSECSTRNPSLDGPGLPHSNPSHLGDVHSIVGHSDGLWDAKGQFISFLALEAWETGTPREERPKATIEITNCLLQSLGVGFLQPPSIRLTLQTRQLVGESDVGKQRSVLTKVPNSSLESPVPNPTARACDPDKSIKLSSCRIKAEPTPFSSERHDRFAGSDDARYSYVYTHRHIFEPTDKNPSDRGSHVEGRAIRPGRRCWAAMRLAL